MPGKIFNPVDVCKHTINGTVQRKKRESNKNIYSKKRWSRKKLFGEITRAVLYVYNINTAIESVRGGCVLKASACDNTWHERRRNLPFDWFWRQPGVIFEKQEAHISVSHHPCFYRISGYTKYFFLNVSHITHFLVQFWIWQYDFQLLEKNVIVSFIHLKLLMYNYRSLNPELY